MLKFEKKIHEPNEMVAIHDGSNYSSTTIDCLMLVSEQTHTMTIIFLRLYLDLELFSKCFTLSLSAEKKLRTYIWYQSARYRFLRIQLQLACIWSHSWTDHRSASLCTVTNKKLMTFLFWIATKPAISIQNL